MVMFYFSGTGNSKYIAELFCQNMDAVAHSIEETVDFESLIGGEEVIGFCYPVYMSRVPRIMREFVAQNMAALVDKKVIIFCTQWLLSGDGARTFTTLFPKRHIQVIYAEHFLMPNNVSNMFVLPMDSDKRIEKRIEKAQHRIQAVCRNIENGIIRKRGFSAVSRVLGLFQGIFLSMVEKRANKSIKVTSDCTKCGICVSICPMANLVLNSDTITHTHNCTMCYRCINQCPPKAITVVFHGKVKKQYQFS
ncbi:MAG: EFR1 family ferrodoxin [Oscillospiraceae bacterium]|nr:EFR1 family ferrodoxin [Oscillospiraceae bacterium]